MDYRVPDQPVDYVKRVHHVPPKARYEHVAETAKALFVIAVFICAVWILGEYILHNAAQADALVSSYTGPACQMDNNTTGHCPRGTR